MPTIPFSQIRAGMVLAVEIESPDGRYRLPAGTVLAENHLKWLRGWRVHEIEATGDSVARTQPKEAAAATGNWPPANCRS